MFFSDPKGNVSRSKMLHSTSHQRLRRLQECLTRTAGTAAGVASCIFTMVEDGGDKMNQPAAVNDPTGDVATSLEWQNISSVADRGPVAHNRRIQYAGLGISLC